MPDVWVGVLRMSQDHTWPDPNPKVMIFFFHFLQGVIIQNFEKNSHPDVLLALKTFLYAKAEVYYLISDVIYPLSSTQTRSKTRGWFLQCIINQWIWEIGEVNDAMSGSACGVLTWKASKWDTLQNSSTREFLPFPIKLDCLCYCVLAISHLSPCASCLSY